MQNPEVFVEGIILKAFRAQLFFFGMLDYEQYDSVYLLFSDFSILDVFDNIVFN